MPEAQNTYFFLFIIFKFFSTTFVGFEHELSIIVGLNPSISFS